MTPDPGDSSSSSKMEKETEPLAKKALKISPGMDTSGATLFRPPPEPTLFTGRKETLKIIAAKAHDTSYPNRAQRVFGNRKNLPDHPIE